jgi:hypothetical protein
LIKPLLKGFLCVMKALAVVWVLTLILWTLYWFTAEDYQPAVNPALSLQLPSDFSGVDEDYEDPDCTISDCSWLNYLHNSVFEGTPNMELTEAADQGLQASLGTNEPQLKCIPENFGYTRAQAEAMFPHIGYPDCADKVGRNESVIQLDTTNNLLTMSCDGWYFLGPPASEERLGFWQYKDTPIKYKGPVKEEAAEWAYGTCEEGRVVDLEGAVYSHRPQPQVIARTKAKMEAMEAVQESVTQPLSVVMLTMDSVSRKQFYRKLPLTHQLLASVDPALFKVFDFKLHNVIGDNSLPNVYPVFTGKPLGTYDKNYNRIQDADMLGEDSIWSYLKEKVRLRQGWTTLLGAEFCDNYFSDGFGKKPDVDHLMTKFWCGAERFSGFK